MKTYRFATFLLAIGTMVAILSLLEGFRARECHFFSHHEVDFQLKDHEALRVNYSRVTVSCNEKRILIVVLSHSSNFAHRHAIRNTWFRYAGEWTGVFLVSGPWNKDVARLRKENDQHKDLLLLNSSTLRVAGSPFFIERIVAILAVARAENYAWAFKTDDDSFVYVPRLLELTTSLAVPFYGGAVFTGASPVRNSNHKDYVSVETWPKPSYPDYASGAGILISSHLFHCFQKHLSTLLHPFADVACGEAARRCKTTAQNLQGMCPFSCYNLGDNSRWMLHKIQPSQMKKIFQFRNEAFKPRLDPTG